jgi:hypothetical protein
MGLNTQGIRGKRKIEIKIKIKAKAKTEHNEESKLKKIVE